MAFNDGLQSVLGGFQYVQGQIEQGEEKRRQQGLRGLLGDYYGQQDPRLGAIARLDPSAAVGAAQFGQTQEQQRQKRLGELAGFLLKAPDAQKPLIWRQIRPEVERYAPGAPMEYTPDVLPMAEQAYSTWGGGAKPEALPAEARTALFFQQHPELAAQEAERYKNRPVFSDGAWYYPKGVPAPAQPPAAAPEGADLAARYAETANFMRQNGVPEEKIIAWLGQQPGMVPAGVDPQAQPMPRGPGMVQVGPTAGQKAYDTERAKTQAGIDLAPQVRANEIATAGGKASAEAEAKRIAQLREDAPKYRRALSSARIKATSVNRAIDGALPMVGVWTAGTVGRPLSEISGTAAANLRGRIATIESNLAFNELQSMRASSPTGGALGSITERELDLLGSTIANLKQSQSPEELRQNLEFVKVQYQKVLDQMEEDYKADYGNLSSAPPSQPSNKFSGFRVLD